MNRFLSLFIFSLILPLIVYAAPSVPQKSVWVVPEDAKKGEEIELNALVYNSTEKAATVTVMFSSEGEDIKGTTISVASKTAATATVPWVMPETAKEVTAAVTKAVDANKKAIPDLVGTVGTFSVGGDKKSFSGTEAQLKGILGKVFSSIDPWRQKQAKHFTELRDKKRAELGIKNNKDVYDALIPKAPEAPATPGSAQSEEDLGDLASDYQGIDIGAYFVLIYATALAAIFASVALFYITLVLLALMVLRFILRMFR